MTVVKMIQRIIELVGLEKGTRDLERSVDFPNMYFLTGQNAEDGLEERYSIYNCLNENDRFDLEKYRAIMEDEEGISTQIIIFKDWESERNLFWDSYDKATKAEQKNLLNQYFTKKISVYASQENQISLEVEESGINYLEYILESNAELNGFIYNVSIYELKKLFNITGSSLFKMNVRNGLRKNTTGRELRRKFRNYLCTGIYDYLVSSDEVKAQEEKIREILEINNEEILKNSVPEKFWFYHNGITIFSVDEKIDRTGNFIRLNPMKVSVINGAQTLTNFFAEWDDLKHNLPMKLKEIVEISQNEIIDILNNVCKRISIKTICIEGTSDNVRAITNGLNTQIPIFKEDIIADQENVRDINKYLRKEGMKIIKSGEEEYKGEGLSVLDFVKRYLLLENQPGKSKNLKKSEIDSILTRAYDTLESDDGRNVTRKLKTVSGLEKWWKDSKKERTAAANDERDQIIDNYGKNYFFSYYLNESEEFEEGLAPEFVFVLYDNFKNMLKKLENNLSLEEFKKDDLFDRYLCQTSTDIKKSYIAKEELDKEEVEELKNYLTNAEVSSYAYAKAIAEYLKMIGKDIFYFRVIKRYRNKDDIYYPKEAFPFPGSTFSELYKESDEDEPKRYLSYEESAFSKEILKIYPLFVIDFEEKKAGKNVISKIEFIKDFTFASKTDEAKEVYEETIEAFKIGDEKLFVKPSDNKDFHIRPKAENANDTFEFTNGLQITRRTFWANKETVNELITSRTL